MWWMFVFGFGNLMYMAPLAIVLSDQFHVSYGEGIMITTTIPLVVMPIAIPLWAKLLDRTHIIHFRAIHGWTFVAGTLAMWLAVYLPAFWLFYLSSFLIGIGFAGGILAWNLGHQHFAPAHKDGQYMAVHVTLNGLRGVIAPIVALWIFEWTRRRELDTSIVFAICVAVNSIGVLGFMSMSRSLRRAEQLATSGDPALALPPK